VLDDELVRAAAGGDGAAFGALIGRHRSSALRIAYAIADGEAEDVAQDATTKAMRQLGRFDTSRPFRPWFLAIVANEARNRRRSFLRRSALVLRVAAESPVDVADVSDVAARNERRQFLLDAVASLSTADREIIGMRYFAELSEAEMAAALHVAPGTVKSRLSRALGRLRAEIGERDA
jgi:RNA polymerase sigma-70 factor, ECF subfamily